SVRGQFAQETVDHGSLTGCGAVRDRVDDRALVVDQRGDALVDRVGGEQVPSGDVTVLADPVHAVLGLVVLGGRPAEFHEGHAGGGGEREPVRGGLERA